MTIFSEETLKLKPITLAAARKAGHVFEGDAAIRKVEELEGALTEEQKRVIFLEGFVDVPYLDTEGNWTIGSGLTKKFRNRTFKETFDEHKARAAKRIKNFANLPEELTAELIQAEYRGDLGESKKFREKFNKAKTLGDFISAAEEFLDNADFRKSQKKGTGVAARMQAVADEVVQYAFKAPLVAAKGNVVSSIQAQPLKQNVAPVAPEELSRALPEGGTASPTGEGALTAEEEDMLTIIEERRLGREADLDASIQREEEFLSQEEQDMLTVIADRKNLGVVHEGAGSEVPVETPNEQDLIQEIF